MSNPGTIRTAVYLLAFASAMAAGGGTIGLVPDPDPARQVIRR